MLHHDSPKGHERRRIRASLSGFHLGSAPERGQRVSRDRTCPLLEQPTVLRQDLDGRSPRVMRYHSRAKTILDGGKHQCWIGVHVFQARAFIPQNL
jgi:hypothetical protein